jgi:hypothetical protein
MHKQTVFDRVRRHLLNQNTRSGIFEHFALPQFRAISVAAYRGSTGHAKCSIGCLIRDGDYSIDMEGLPIRKMLEAFPHMVDILSVETEDDVTFLEALQNVHDTIPVQSWDLYLAMVANKYGLYHPTKEMIYVTPEERKARRQARA